MDINLFTEKLTEAIEIELRFWKRRLSSDTIRAFCIVVIPFEGFLGLSFLTNNEDFNETGNSKWATVADWRWLDFNETNWKTRWEVGESFGIIDWMVKRVEETDDEMEFVKACVRAATSEQVRAKLKEYNLSEDFEVGVLKGDGGNLGDDINHCPPWTW